jgi:tetratricopeptide (TPR) repeat protein
MTLGYKDVTLAARGSVACGLLVYVLVVLGGCSGTTAQKSLVDPAGTPPTDKTEAQLLADLNTKFEDPQAHYELARVYHKAQNWNKAEYHYNVALGFNPANRAAQAGFVKMFADRGNKTKAEQEANSYIRQAGISVKETLRLGWEFEQLGMDEYALRCYRQAIAAAPDSDAANKQIGLYYLGKGDSANAKVYLMRSFELNPRQPDIAGALGRLGVVVQTPGIPKGPLEEKTK